MKMLQFDKPFFLAPMAGITDAPFRLLCAEQGAALTVTEMVSAKGLWYGDRKSFDLLQPGTGGHAPVSFQLFGADPVIMGAAVEKIESMRAPMIEGRAGVPCLPYGLRPDAYDVNMGCPVLKVVRNGEGSALMKDPDMAGRIVEAMAGKTDKPVTVKMRIGWDSDTVNAVEFAKVVESAGAAAVCVHGRTRSQFYDGPADWTVIGSVKAAVSVAVYGSGDVFTGFDAVRMLRETGCDGVMAARGALGYPWIFSDALMVLSGASEEEVLSAAPDIRARAGMFIRQAKLTNELKGEYITVREMRKHAGWYFKGKPGVTILRNEVNRAATLNALIKVIEDFV